MCQAVFFLPFSMSTVMRATVVFAYNIMEYTLTVPFSLNSVKKCGSVTSFHVWID